MKQQQRAGCLSTRARAALPRYALPTLFCFPLLVPSLSARLATACLSPLTNMSSPPSVSQVHFVGAKPLWGTCEPLGSSQHQSTQRTYPLPLPQLPPVAPSSSEPGHSPPHHSPPRQAHLLCPGTLCRGPGPHRGTCEPWDPLSTKAHSAPTPCPGWRLPAQPGRSQGTSA